MLTLIVLSQPERAWRFCACITGSALACALLSAAYPAIGAFKGLHVPHDILARLPDGAGIYHLPAFEAYREGTSKVLDVTKLAGVITFPSFHTAMAVATAYAWGETRFCAMPMALWNMVVIVSTVPMGGHYFIDLVAGAGLCLILLALTRSRGSESQLLPMATAGQASPSPAYPLNGA